VDFGALARGLGVGDDGVLVGVVHGVEKKAKIFAVCIEQLFVIDERR
jgi:hypothetical protein